MTEFAFEGGHREGPDFLQHLEDRQKGLPRVNSSLTTGLNAWGDLLGGPPESGFDCSYEPVPQANQSADGIETAAVYRMESIHDAGTKVGEVPYNIVSHLLAPMMPPHLSRHVAEGNLTHYLRKSWGGGVYRIRGDVSDYVCTVGGPGRAATEAKAKSQPSGGGGAEGALAGRLDSGQRGGVIAVGVTVWLDLSRGGPYKVVGPYNHPLGAAVPAHHPHDAPNTFETVRVAEGLWLCQDAKGVVHILAGGSLTLTPPASRFGKTARAVSWCWAKREVVLWAAIASLAAALAL